MLMLSGEGKRQVMINPVLYYNISQELLIEIFSRLPVRSLFRFKCVCKLWCNLISAKDFPFLHLNNFKPSDSDLVLAGIYHPLNLSTVHVSLSSSSQTNRLVHFRLPEKNSFDQVLGLNPEVCGPCNGVFCLYRQEKDRILLWNPLIRDTKVIPQSGLYRPQGLRGWELKYRVGFGFDSETNDYKILKIVQNALVIKQQVELYSLRNDSWRKINDTPLNSFCVSDVLFTTYGKIGWLGRLREIILYDLRDETFDMIPVCLEGEYRREDAVTQVFPIRESIAVVISTVGYCEIWVLNNDLTCTQSRSWSKLCTVRVENLYWPLGFYGNSHLIFRGRDCYKLKLYHLLNNDVVDVGASMVRALVYKESLISVSGVYWKQYNPVIQHFGCEAIPFNMGGEGKRRIMIRPIYLPEELFIEILSRLPVKSLFRFKCVCKSWRSQISAKDFPFLHLNNYNPSHFVLAGMYHPLFLTTACVSRSSPPRVCAEVGEEEEEACRSRIVHYRLPEHHSFDKSTGLNPEVCGPCNGIFCLYRQRVERILLWNPQIQDFKIIPQSGATRQASNVLRFSCKVGFCFDTVTNDYKILKIVQMPSQPQKQRVELYSLRTNSWRKLDTKPPNSYCVSNVLFTTCRKIGWLGKHRQIFLFDVSDETFDMIPISLNGECRSSDRVLQVFPFRESIAVVISTIGYCEIWVLNGFTCTAESRSWSKLWTIDLEYLYLPLGFCGNSYLIFQSYGSCKLKLYNLLNNHVVNVGASMTKALIYKESLISISGNNWKQ